jgi:hypothetical protein
MKTYSEMITLPSFIDRYRYLKIDGRVGEDTFGWDRYLNQTLYRSKEWRDLRNAIIVRDDGCDLGCPDYPIAAKILIHHINPISKQDILNRNPLIFDPENLVCVSHLTHEAIHYGSEELLIGNELIERKPGDTILW